jgi:protocatechuate 3,4-dioxygenase alpha subunit
MTPKAKLVPSGSQTVGPYYRIGLQYLIDRQPVDGGTIELRGRVIDRDGVPVTDAMLEFWGADESGNYPDSGLAEEDLPAQFRRAATDEEGRYCVSLTKPGPTPFGNGQTQAPHCVVLVFARGLLRHLITRVYFADESANAVDPVLSEVPEDRRYTLIARPVGNERSFQWDIFLQGKDETAFFAW